ncbi:MAG: hypothetical protein M1837_002807 [Sclerophora amabilis]|nr:MAG: hypothetical protein M1837_002807 [Sclerophora amabilis]
MTTWPFLFSASAFLLLSFSPARCYGGEVELRCGVYHAKCAVDEAEIFSTNTCILIGRDYKTWFVANDEEDGDDAATCESECECDVSDLDYELRCGESEELKIDTEYCSKTYAGQEDCFWNRYSSDWEPNFVDDIEEDDDEGQWCNDECECYPVVGRAETG